ncbi:alpha/beta-hydrolase [Didymella exigua CBS 183.55]|uniref:Alpha/beta-hydrolase n=1 Tax=Didymella exigua CBS 183.55 TaxID=1150837 RepID=A0A6A5S4I7_9PLEO|nr:alpha/beta-hydrolase [Didymella exigua CBS 183.55]KAF1934258.1 alpha/beta-hydrolase [Didymella exigua CBS 183.55]
MIFLSLFLVILLNALLSDAVPLVPEKRAIDTMLLQTFRLMSQYASAAYCTNNFNSPGTQIQCGSGNCPLVEAADSATVLEYSKTETLTDVTGFVAIDHTNNVIMVSFRGSQSIDNWLTNLDFGLTATDICSGCTAHSGFYQSWLDARDTVTPAVQAAVKKYPAYKVSVTGHSLGGAIAPFAAAQLRNKGLAVALYTFGSPRVGGSALSSYISNQKGGNYRVTHWNDPVPRVPLLVMGYVHTSPEYYINKKNKAAITESDFQVIEGSVNLFKGNAAWLLTDIEAHRWYFTQMYTCADSKQKREVEALEGLDIVARF